MEAEHLRNSVEVERRPSSRCHITLRLCAAPFVCWLFVRRRALRIAVVMGRRRLPHLVPPIAARPRLAVSGQAGLRNRPAFHGLVFSLTAVRSIAESSGDEILSPTSCDFSEEDGLVDDTDTSNNCRSISCNLFSCSVFAVFRSL